MRSQVPLALFGEQTLATHIVLAAIFGCAAANLLNALSAGVVDGWHGAYPSPGYRSASSVA